MSDNILAKRFTPLSIFKFALPNIIMMVFFSLYTIVDGMFISRFVGTLALSACNMSYPLTSVQLAVGIMLSTGGSAVIAWEMGRGEKNKAKAHFTFLTLVSLFIGILFTVFGIPFLDPIMKFLGTSELQMADCRIYTRILLWFSPVMFLQTFFQMFFVTAGKPGLGLFTIVAGGLSNVFLDLLFMGVMKMGVAGAAIATGIGYSFPVIAGIIYFSFFRKANLTFVKPKFSLRTLTKSCFNGSSEMVTNISVAVTTFLFNIILMEYAGENGVAAITIFSYYQFVFSAVYTGFSMGVAPIISYKYGAGDKKQLEKIIKSSIIFIVISSVCVFVISMLTFRTSLEIFTGGANEVYELAVNGFPMFAISFVFMGISIFSSSMFTAYSNGIVSGIISFARTFIFLVTSLLILPLIWEETGIWLAVPVAEFLGLLVSVGFLIWGRKKYNY